jgi:hypothetical protein
MPIGATFDLPCARRAVLILGANVGAVERFQPVMSAQSMRADVTPSQR